MKKTKFFVIALLCQYLFIQSALSQSQTPEDRFLEVVSDLDLTLVQQSTGIFYDQVPGYVPFHVFMEFLRS
jgi:phenylalanine-4-hydroxylase